MIFSEGVDLYVNETELHLSREQENAIKPSTIRKFNMTGMKRIITQTENPISSYFTNANFSGAAPLSGSSSNDRSWCVAKESASPDSLQTALDWVCAYGGIDCEAIKLGSACYVPNNVYSHSSYAFNSYYQIHGHASGSCDFNGVATITSEDPSMICLALVAYLLKETNIHHHEQNYT